MSVDVRQQTLPQLAALGSAVISTVLETAGEELAADVVRELIAKFGAAWMRGHLDAFDAAEVGAMAAEIEKFGPKP